MSKLDITTYTTDREAWEGAMRYADEHAGEFAPNKSASIEAFAQHVFDLANTLNRVAGAQLEGAK